MNIRFATAMDAPAISTGEYEAAQTPGLMIALPGEIPESAYRERIEALKANTSGLYIVAENNGVVVGHLLLDPMPLSTMAHVCSLTIVVYPRWQGLGFGRALMEYAIEWAKSVSAVEKIELSVRATNDRAIALYRSFGFEEEGRLRNRVKLKIGMEQLYIDNILMRRFVESEKT